MTRRAKIVIPILLLAAVAVICVFRWQAWFGMPDEPLWNDERQTYVFPLFAHDSTPESLDILVLGDIHNRLTCADYDTIAARVPMAEAVAQTGDWLDRGQNYYYQLLLREWLPSRLCGLPVIACPGNHEYTKGLKKGCAEPWQNAFVYPDNGPVDVPGASYYLDFPQLRFIVIDTNPLDRLVYLTRTLTWLRILQKEAGGRYVAVMMHHPVLSAAKGRINPLIYAAFRHALSEADIVLAGHDHSYMRYKQFVVLNSAGKPKEQHPLAILPDVTDSVPAYGEICITDSAFRFTAYRLSDGSAIDSLYVKHD